MSVPSSNREVLHVSLSPRPLHPKLHGHNKRTTTVVVPNPRVGFSAVVHALPVRKASQLTALLSPIKDTLRGGDVLWKEKIKAIHKLAGLVMGGAERNKAFRKHLLELRGPLADALSHHNTAVMLECLVLLTFLARYVHLYSKEEDWVDFFVPAVIRNTAASPQAVVRVTGEQCSNQLLVYHHLGPKLFTNLMNLACYEKNPKMRLRAVECLTLALEKCLPGQTKTAIPGAIRGGLLSSGLLDNKDVILRATTRQACYAFMTQFPQLRKDFLESMSQDVRSTLTSEEEEAYKKQHALRSELTKRLLESGDRRRFSHRLQQQPALQRPLSFEDLSFSTSLAVMPAHPTRRSKTTRTKALKHGKTVAALSRRGKHTRHHSTTAATSKPRHVRLSKVVTMEPEEKFDQDVKHVPARGTPEEVKTGTQHPEDVDEEAEEDEYRTRLRHMRRHSVPHILPSYQLDDLVADLKSIKSPPETPLFPDMMDDASTDFSLLTSASSLLCTTEATE